MASKASPTRGSGRRPGGLAAAARAERMAILEAGLPFGGNALPPGRGNETKRRILDTAIALFAERGFDACTMRDLAAEVGIKAPAIYNHYSSKDQVLASSMEYILGQFFWALLSPLEEDSVESWLEQIVKGHVRFQLNNRRLSQANDALLNAPGTERVLPSEVYHRIVGVERAYVELISILVRLSSGTKDRSDALMAGFAITAMCDRVVAWYDPEGSLKAEQVATRSWKLARQMVRGA